MNVQRYKVGYYSDEWGMSSNTPCLLKDDNGYAVKFEDYEQLRQRVAELEKERDEEIACNRPLRNLIASLEEQKSHWNKQRDQYREAVSTMDSERSANAMLTAERDELLAALEAGRRLIELISPFEGDVTRQIDKAIASVKEKLNDSD